MFNQIGGISKPEAHEENAIQAALTAQLCKMYFGQWGALANDWNGSKRVKKKVLRGDIVRITKTHTNYVLHLK